MGTDKAIILTSKIEDLKKQRHTHHNALSRARKVGNLQTIKFEQSCIDECNKRIEKAKEELQGL